MAHKVTFTKDFDFSPKSHNGMVTTAYRSGQTATITDEAFEAASAAGVIESASNKTPSKTKVSPEEKAAELGGNAGGKSS